MSPLQPSGLGSLCYVLVRGSSLGQFANTVPREGGAASTPCSDGKEAVPTHVSRATEFNPLTLQVGKWGPRELRLAQGRRARLWGRARKNARPFRVSSEMGRGSRWPRNGAVCVQTYSQRLLGGHTPPKGPSPALTRTNDIAEMSDRSWSWRPDSSFPAEDEAANRSRQGSTYFRVFR